MGMLSNECRTTLVHPHGRGDNERFGVVWSRVDGSPPRAWGQFNAARSSQSKPRFTPTGVGTMLDRSKYAFPHLVHPHGRGDNSSMTLSRARMRGSPPRAWGQWGAPQSGTRPSRFTPTGVGTMMDGLHPGRPTTVHPHGRGDNAIEVFAYLLAAGSPPRAWGQSRGLYAESSVLRFTPTGVGTIDTSACARSPRAVHPHGRGDNIIDRIACRYQPGSPPRAWGQ